MNPVLQVVYMSITVLIHYKILHICLMALILRKAIKGETKRVGISVLSFFIAMVVLIGIPSGIVKGMYPEHMPNAEQEIIKEVTTWNR